MRDITDLLCIADLGAGQLERLVERAARMKADRTRGGAALAGRKIGLFFEKPSARTRVSSETAAVELGAHPVVLGQSEVGLGSRESAEDLARMLERYLDVLALRVFRHGVLVEMARVCSIPVINLLSDVEHPCQAVADWQTIAEHREPAGAVVAYVGDGNNVCHSLMAGAALLGAEVRVVGPPGFAPDASYIEHCGERVLVTDDLAAVEGADVVYTDVWASMGQESEAAARRERFAPYRVDEALFARARPDAVFMHCLPAHRGEEVTDGVLDHPRSRVFDQAENRLHSMKSILMELAG